MTPDQTAAVENVLVNCGGLQAGDRVLILCDRDTRAIAEAFQAAASARTCTHELMEIPPLPNHGAEPPAPAAHAMARSTLILSLCRYSLAHTNARIEAGRKGARFLSLPLYDFALLASPALRIDFRAQFPLARRLADALTQGAALRVTTRAGTDMRMDVGGRVGNCCPGFVEAAGDLGSPPDVESNISPVEDRSEGVVVVDGSITHPEIGLVRTPVSMYVRGGRIAEIRGGDSGVVDALDQMFGDVSSPRRVLAESGFGLNPAAELTGNMLTDEGTLGCAHFGFGANHTVGGTNAVDFHMDFVFREATVMIDGRTVMKEGVPLL